MVHEAGGCRWHEHLLEGAEGKGEGKRIGSDCHKWRLETPDGQWSEVDSTARVFGLFSGPALRVVRSCAAPYGTVDYQEDARDVREAAVEAVQESRRQGWEGRGWRVGAAEVARRFKLMQFPPEGPEAEPEADSEPEAEPEEEEGSREPASKRRRVQAAEEQAAADQAAVRRTFPEGIPGPY